MFALPRALVFCVSRLRNRLPVPFRAGVVSRWLCLALAVAGFTTHAYGGVPIQFNVNTPGDGAPTTASLAACANNTAGCNLRSAVASALMQPTQYAVVIVFDSSLTASATQAAPAVITLTNGQLELTRSITISGPGANLLSVSGNGRSRIVQVDSGVTSDISGLTLTMGTPPYNANPNVGGAILNQGSLQLTDATVSGSSSPNGGGIYSSGPALKLLRVTISGNGVTGSGGGLQATAGALNITDSTLSGNTCSNQIGPCPGGGGLALSSVTGQIVASTISRNYSDRGSNFTLSGSTLTVANTLSDDLSGTYANDGGNIIEPSTNVPLLAPLGFYGGPTQTMPPLPGSPAICAGLVRGTDGAAIPAMDQRGFSHSPRYCTGGSQQDAGAVQTGYALAFSTQPGNSFVNQPIAGPPGVLLTEQQNPFTLAAETVNLAINSGTLSNTSATTSTTTGTATLTASDNTAGAADTLSASVTVAPAGSSPTTTATATSNPFSETLIIVSPNSSVVASPTQVFVTQPSTITVTVVSTSGAPIANATVTVSSTNHGAFNQNSGSTNANGVISFQLTDATPETDVISAVVTYNGASTTLTQTATVTFQAPIFTVNTLADDATGVAQNCIASSNAPCTLRDAAAASNSVASGGNNVIQFAPALAGTQAAASTITLTNGVLNLTRSTTIQGPGANLLSISGNYGGTGSASQVLQIAAGVTANVSGLTLTKGNATGSGNNAAGGAITNQGTLNLTDSTISASLAGVGGGFTPTAQR